MTRERNIKEIQANRGAKYFSGDKEECHISNFSNAPKRMAPGTVLMRRILVNT